LNFSEFQQKVRQLLVVDLPSGNSVIKQAHSMAGKSIFDRAPAGLKEAGADMINLGAETDPDQIISEAQPRWAEALLISTHNGMALDYARRLKENMDRRKATIPVVLGGILNQKVENLALPVDVSGDLKQLGFYADQFSEGKIMSLKNRTIAFIGGGHITEIIVSNLTKTDKIDPQRLIVSDPVKEKGQHLKKTYGISVAEDNVEAVLRGDFLFINVLPHVVGKVVEELKRSGFPDNRVIISVAAGIPIKTYAFKAGIMDAVDSAINRAVELSQSVK
jgi:methylmalonyl-CoA mutase cobalamin-binding subunit